MITVNEIEKLYGSVFYTRLKCPTMSLLDILLSDSFDYLLMINHNCGGSSWTKESMVIMRENANLFKVWTRYVQTDVILTMSDFKKVRETNAIKSGHFVQIQTIPPDFFDPKKIKDKAFYDVLGNIGWNFELILPNLDYAELLSPSKTLLEKAIEFIENGSAKLT